MREPRNETNAMWRDFKGEGRARADIREPLYRQRLAAIAERGAVRTRPLGAHGIRITSATVRPIDYWPRTGKWRTPDGKVEGHGWLGLLKYLGVTE